MRDVNNLNVISEIIEDYVKERDIGA